jgi:hypothetical protein
VRPTPNAGRWDVKRGAALNAQAKAQQGVAAAPEQAAKVHAALARRTNTTAARPANINASEPGSGTGAVLPP